MTLDLDYLDALGDARSCLAALADSTAEIDESSHFERLLIELDVFNPEGPATHAITGDSDELLVRLETAIERMLQLGGDQLRLELVLDGALTRNSPE
ncbi:hypothetical protein [Nocardioides terrae]|uniref:hypothetical protein n=1 Tax=Nocardioides terrae TaxID=574651 RepID=UPI000B84CBCA|nr:hypothetical protein [Nocardioides terrae]